MRAQARYLPPTGDRPERPTLRAARASLRAWSVRRWLVAVAASAVVALVVGLPTDVIPNPVFGRPVVVTWWSYPVLAVTALLGGMVVATYIREPAGKNGDADVMTVDGPLDPESERVARTGGVAGLLSVFAVGCPVCNHLVVLAIGVTGARQWFEPFQPVLAFLSVGLLVYALVARLNWLESCPLPLATASGSAGNGSATPGPWFM